MSGYAKVFSSIWEGSMRGKADPLFIFVNLLTHANQHGIVDRHWQAIADETGVPAERVREALTFLEAPDKETRTPGDDGRRIVRLDEHRSWGWRIVNHKLYREMCSRGQNAERQARFRANQAQAKTNDNPPPVAGEGGGTEKTKAFIPPTVEEVSAYLSAHPKGKLVDAAMFVSQNGQKGWMVGKHKMVDWHLAIATWIRKRETGEIQTGTPGATQQTKKNPMMMTPEEIRKKIASQQ